MRETLLAILRCPFCGGRLTLVDNQALERTHERIESGVLGCDCCAFPVLAGIPVLIADDTTREAMHQLEADQREQALLTLLGLDAARAMSFRSLMHNPRPTYRDALAILSLDAEADCFLYRFSDPTFLTIEALLMGLVGQSSGLDPRPVLDLCGGSGHVTRVLAGLEPTGGVINADVYFWKLWMARRFTAPSSDAICCDANNPLPLARDACSLVVLADAFPYIWHKRLLAEEMMRAVGSRGAIVLPHLHSSLGENFSAGMTLTPAGYASLLGPQAPRLFSDDRLFEDVLNQTVDLTCSTSPAEIGTEPSFTLVASRREDLFRKYVVSDPREIRGELKVNPLYRIDPRGDSSVLTLTFPTPEYEEEFGACKQYLPSTVTVPGDLTGPIVRGALGPQYDELRRRRVIIDAPPDYC